MDIDTILDAVGDNIAEAYRNGLERYIAQRWPHLCNACVCCAADEYECSSYQSWPEYLAEDGSWLEDSRLACGCCSHGDDENSRLYHAAAEKVLCAGCGQVLGTFSETDRTWSES